MGLFIAEGELVISRALAAGYELRSALVSPRWLSGLLPALGGTDGPVYVGAEPLLRAVAGFHVHRGALASMRRKPLPAFSQVVDASRRLLVIEDMVSHTNLGAVFRSAAGLGVDGVLLSPSCADPLYRRSVRVSMGGVFSLPWAKLSSWPGGLESLRAAGFSVLALTPSETAEEVASVRPSTGDRLALLLGTEGAGLSSQALALADRQVRIPMSRGVDSLNVAAAAAIACYVLGAASPPQG